MLTSQKKENKEEVAREQFHPHYESLGLKKAQSQPTLSLIDSKEQIILQKEIDNALNIQHWHDFSQSERDPVLQIVEPVFNISSGEDISNIVSDDWIEIDMNAVRHNIQSFKTIVGPNVEVIAVVKADGYGMGAYDVGRAALAAGASFLAVARANEAFYLRQNGLMDVEVLLLGQASHPFLEDLLREHITLTVGSRAFWESIRQILSTHSDLTARVELKVDSGMGRLGYNVTTSANLQFLIELAEEIHSHPQAELCGIFTHMAFADSDTPTYTIAQEDLFFTVVKQLEIRNCCPKRIHAYNSAATFLRGKAAETKGLNAVRVGISLYGPSPFAYASPNTPFAQQYLQPVLRKWAARVAMVKSMPAHSKISYGCTYETKHNEPVAVVAVGYADGLHREANHPHEVLLHGVRVPVRGRVCMDAVVVSLLPLHTRGIAVAEGDEVVIIGKQGEEEITLDEFCDRVGTIPHTVLTGFRPRVKRVVIDAEPMQYE